MDYQKFIFGLFLLIIPLIILVLFYKNYVYNYCKNDISCLKDKLINNLNTLGKKINNKQQKEESGIIRSFVTPAEETEHFAGISDWFMGSSTPNQLPISSSTNLEEKSLTALEKKIADRARVSTTFPPSDEVFRKLHQLTASPAAPHPGQALLGAAEIPNSTGSRRAYLDADPMIPDNKEFLAQIENKPYLKDKNSGITNGDKENDFHPLVDKAVDGASQIPHKLQQELPPATPSIPTKVIIPKPDAKLSPFGKCNFFNDKCPDDHHPLGNFSIGGLGNNTMLQCGQVQNGKNGAAVALLRNNSIHDIHITDQGHGYNPSSPPKVIIEGGKGTGAKAEAIVDDNGFLKIINVKNPGYNYVDTPIITIESPYINSSCHLCCKNE